MRLGAKLMGLGYPDPRALRDARLDDVPHGNSGYRDEGNDYHVELETGGNMGCNLSIVVPQQDGEQDNAKGADDGTFVFIGPPAKCGEIDAFILAKVTS